MTSPLPSKPTKPARKPEPPLWERIIFDQSLRLSGRSGVECDQSSRPIGERATQVVVQTHSKPVAGMLRNDSTSMVSAYRH